MDSDIVDSVVGKAALYSDMVDRVGTKIPLALDAEDSDAKVLEPATEDPDELNDDSVESASVFSDKDN